MSSRISGAIHGNPKAAYTSSSVWEAMIRPDSASDRAYSLRIQPRPMAICRSLMLWAFDPVKYI